MTIVAVVGLPGSGKTQAVQYLVTRGFTRVYFGKVTFDTLDKQGLAHTEENERKVREELRRQHGMAAYGILNLDTVKQLHEQQKDVVIESFYSWSSYKLYKETFGEDFVVLAIHASPSVRYARLARRDYRGLTREHAKERDYAQIEQLEQAGPIAMADYVIVNEDTTQAFTLALDTALRTYQE